MKLYYKKLGDGKPLFILHGLFGSSDNWQTLGKKLAETYTVIFVDQRNHGHSPQSDAFNYDLMADDLHELVSDLGYEKINVLGHSMGGKTAIKFAVKYPELVDKLVVADISHKAYPLHHDRILEGLNALDLTKIKTRGEAEEFLATFIPEFAIRQFLLKNLYWVAQGELGWRINIPVLSRDIREVIAAISFDKIAIDTLFIRGGQSNYILEADYTEIQEKFTNSTIETIEKSGHWLHAEAPEEFYQLLVDFLN